MGCGLTTQLTEKFATGPFLCCVVLCCVGVVFLQIKICQLLSSEIMVFEAKSESQY